MYVQKIFYLILIIRLIMIYRYIYIYGIHTLYIIYKYTIYITLGTCTDTDQCRLRFFSDRVLVPPIRTGCISGVRGEPGAPGLSPCAAFRTRSVHTNRVRPLSIYTHSGRCGPMKMTTRKTMTTKTITNKVDGVRV